MYTAFSNSVTVLLIVMVPKWVAKQREQYKLHKKGKQ